MNPAFRPASILRPATACALVLLAAACGGRRVVLPAPSVLGPVPPAWVIYDDDAGGMRDSVRLVVRDPAALDALWRTATDGQASPPPVPAIDFAREMVVAVGAGRMAPDDRIRVDSVGMRRQLAGDGRLRESLVVMVRTTEACGPFPAAVWPLQLVRVRRHDGPVVFVEQRVRGEACARG